MTNNATVTNCANLCSSDSNGNSPLVSHCFTSETLYSTHLSETIQSCHWRRYYLLSDQIPGGHSR